MWNVKFIPFSTIYVDGPIRNNDLAVMETRALLRLHTGACIIEIGALKTNTAIYRCEWCFASVTNPAERTTGVGTAGDVVGILHVVWTLGFCEQQTFVFIIAKYCKMMWMTPIIQEQNIILLMKYLTTGVWIHPSLDNDPSGGTGVGIGGEGGAHTLPDISTLTGVINAALQ